ncbi:MAG: baseplate J/gp47 family protein [Chloroflexi bacterium]|nr:baseplate J/gp47 family protein [Chloroflexota bacterium]
MAEIVTVEPLDDLASLKYKLEQVGEGETLLCVPRAVTLFQNPLYLRLLRRYIQGRGMRVSLVVEDRDTRQWAKAEGFSTYTSLRRIKTIAEGKEEQGVPSEGAPRKPRGQGLKILVGSALFGFFLLFSLGAYLFFPTGTATLTPESKIISETFPITASILLSSPDYTSRRIAARQVQAAFTYSDKIEVTGKRSAPTGVSSGQVTLQSKSNSRIVVPRGTLLSTSTGILFQTVDDAILTTTGSITRTRVIATEPGSKANVEIRAIDKVADETLNSQLLVWNESPIQGGADKETTYVTTRDINNLKQQMDKNLAVAGFRQIAAARKESESLYPQTVSVSIRDSEYDKSVGAEGPNLELTMRGTATGLVFEGKDVNDISLVVLKEKVPIGFRLLPDSLKIQPLEANQWDKDSITFHVAVDGRAIPVMDKGKVSEAIRGKTVEDAEGYLAQKLPLSERPTMMVQPPWARFLPIFFWEVKIREG